MKRKWYIGKYRGRHWLHEICYGAILTGYWYAGGPENKPYTHRFYGLVWAGKWTFGVGYIQPEEPMDLAKSDLVDESKDTGEFIG